jgi:hypothetical protein
LKPDVADDTIVDVERDLDVVSTQWVATAGRDGRLHQSAAVPRTLVVLEDYFPIELI